MKRFLLFAFTLSVWCMGQSAWAQSAMEKAENRLADLLAPGTTLSGSGFTSEPRQWHPSRAVVDILLPVQPYTGKPVRLPEPQRADVKPRALPEAQPLISFREQPVLPKDVQLPTKPLIRLPSIDVHRPLPIPILAQPQKDRASLGDPALEASLNAALKPFTPARTQPVPFAPINLPDPFEHIRTGQLRNPPEENPMPPVIPLQKPTK